jgi:hypothetical protein
MAEIHLAAANRLFKQTEPALFAKNELREKVISNIVKII